MEEGERGHVELTHLPVWETGRTANKVVLQGMCTLWGKHGEGSWTWASYLGVGWRREELLTGQDGRSVPIMNTNVY